MKCKCEKTFCIQHRTPELHACTFDHKAEGAAELAAKNPKIVAAKLESI
jgi:predicted nucleic acid binding AN1-type Zn finger protein